LRVAVSEVRLCRAGRERQRFPVVANEEFGLAATLLALPVLGRAGVPRAAEAGKQGHERHAPGGSAPQDFRERVKADLIHGEPSRMLRLPTEDRSISMCVLRSIAGQCPNDKTRVAS
jgi:hypothetical protein